MITLYKKDSKGKVRVLMIGTKNEILFQQSGLIDGNHIIHEKACKPKNVGRANATTAEEQAILEMNSKVKEKLTEGYSSSLEELESNDTVLPMLAKNFEDEVDKIDWETAYAQPKLDGMRSLKKKINMISRKNKIIDTLPHIAEELPDIEEFLDGELYAHGKNFQENMRLIKKNRGAESEEVKYHVYDMISDLPFAERYAILSNLVEWTNHLRLVPTVKINSKKELDEVHAKFLSEGYEGTMLRWGKEGYKVNARSSNLLKYKDFQDITAEIIDIEPADQRPEWGVPVLRYSEQKMDGLHTFTFRAGMKYSHEDRKEFLTNKDKYIGLTAEIRFFEYSEDGIPRFPVMVGIRLDK